MVIKRTKSRVKQKVVETPASSSTISGKHADLKIRSGLNLLLLAEKKALEERGSLTTSSSPGSASVTSLAKTVSFSATVSSAGSFKQSEMANSALLQLAEMCTSELESATKNKQAPECPGVLCQLNPSVLAGSVLTHSHPNSIVPPPEKRACQWGLTKDIVNVSSSSTTSNRDVAISNRSSFISNSLSPQDSPLMTLRCTSAEPRWSTDKYDSLEKYRSASSGRKLSSSATESIPSPSSSFGDETEDGTAVFSSQLEQSKDSNLFSSNRDLDLSNPHCSLSVDSDCKLINSFYHHNSNPHQHLSSHQQQPHPRQQSPTHKHVQPLLTASPNTISRLLFLRNSETTSISDKQSSLMPHQNRLLSMKTVLPADLHIDKNLDTNSEDKNQSQFQKWKEQINSRFGEISPASTDPTLSSKIVGEGSSPVISVNFTEWRQQHCSELGKTNSPATTHSHDVKQSSTACHVSFSKTSSLLSESKLASLLSKTDSPKDRFALGVSDMPPSWQGTDHEVKNFNTTCQNSSQAGPGNMSFEQNIPELSSTGTSFGNRTQSLPDNVVDTKPETVNSTFSNQSLALSKGKLKKKWTERMLVEIKQEEQLGQHQSEVKNGCQVLRTSLLDVRPDLHINDIRQNGPGPDILSHTNHSNDSEVVRHPEQTEEMKISNNELNSQPTQFSLIHTSGSLIGSSSAPVKAELGPTNEITSFKASRHPKLLFQLSQSPHFSKPAHLKLQSSLSNVQIKSEQDQHILNCSNQHAVGGLSMKKDTSNMDVTYKNNLQPIAACGKRCMDHIVEQLCKSDFYVDPQTFNKQFSVESSSTPIVRSETPQEVGASMVGLRNETCEGLVKAGNEGLVKAGSEGFVKAGNQGLDMSVMTASSLVEKVIREWRDGCSVNNKVDRACINGRHVEFSEGSNMSVNFESPSSTCAAADISLDGSQIGEISKTPSAARDAHCLSPSAPAESYIHTEHTSLKPTRKSRRANKGKKYQELIKEGVIQPSRERLAAWDAEKQELEEDQLGDVQEEMNSPPVFSLEPPNKRKSRQRICDNKSVETAKASHMSNTAVTSHTSSGQSCNEVSASGGPRSRLKLASFEAGYPATHIAWPKKDLPKQPVTGSQKRKARKHCITRISILREDALSFTS